MNSLVEHLRAVSDHPKLWTWCWRAILVGFALCTIAAGVIVWGDSVTVGGPLFIAGFVIAAAGILVGNVGAIAGLFGARK